MADIRVLIVDPGEVYRRALLDLVQRGGNQLRVVGEAREPADAAEIAAMDPPSVIVLGARRASDHRLVTELRQIAPSAGIVVLSMVDDGPTVVESLRAGALGFLPMGATEDDIYHAITAVAQGKPAVHPSVAGSALMWAAQTEPPRDSAREDDALEGLTRREREILDMLAEGTTPAEIAAKLFVSRRTVETHLANTYRKLGVHGRIDAIRRLELKRVSLREMSASMVPERRGA